MRNLLWKELRLAAHPTLFVFLFMGALLLIPAYPYCVVFFFGCLGPTLTFVYGRETHDVFYTATLPIPKRDVVKGKCLLIVTAQLGTLLISLPFAVLRMWTPSVPNPVGLEANVAYYGFGLLTFALFDLVFLTHFYKTAYQAGRAMLCAGLPAAAVMLVMESLAHIPATQWMDGMDAPELLRQVPILLLGAAAYAGALPLACRIASARFARVDL